MTIADLLARREGVDFEAKAAQGRDGRGEVPGSVWESYAAMANSQGGDLVLGVREHPDGSVDVLGLAEPERVVKTFWDNVHNRQIVSANLLRNDDVQIVEEDGVAVVHVAVPRAGRKERPVYVGENPFAGTFRRDHEGDYRCPEAEVRRMIADAEQDTRDARILTGYTLNDLDADSLSAFRNEFRSASPNHVWLTYDDRDLLEQLGGWRRDRDTGEVGLTLAGLLMFGQLRPILDALPDYVLDYRDVEPDSPGIRWTDRVTTDGTWPGNLYAFYRRAFSRLVRDLRVPFQTEAGRRVDETPVHRALKEALVNALIHADYSGSTPILILKKLSSFSFRNPGTLRIPPAQVRAGGHSDCRNRNLQKMFQMIGSAEQAGSGFPTILGAWRDQHWRPPSLIEDVELGHVTLRLSTASLFPDGVLDELQARFGEAFSMLPEAERTAVVTATIEGQVSNARLQELFDLHPAAITQLLGRLVSEGLLETHGKKRWTYYTLTPVPEGQHRLDFDSGDTDQNSTHSDQTSTDTDQSPAHSDQTSTDTDQTSAVAARLRPYLEAAKSIRDTQWALPEKRTRGLMAVLTLARERGEFLTVDDLTVVLNRSKPSVYRYLRQIKDDVETQFSGHRAPGQGYRARSTQ